MSRIEGFIAAVKSNSNLQFAEHDEPIDVESLEFDFATPSEYFKDLRLAEKQTKTDLF
jgi:hypothetical protein